MNDNHDPFSAIGLHAALILNRLSTERQLRDKQRDNEVDKPDGPAKADKHDDKPNARHDLMERCEKPRLEHLGVCPS